MAKHYYNENNPYAAQWLRNLIWQGLIPPGDVDDRSITEVAAKDLEGYCGIHLFAGIGGWAYALRLAGWPDDQPVLTGSCPCQPFSVSGKRKGKRDDRHLWPDMHRLIKFRRPPVVFGEQVAGKDGRDWYSGVRTDLEAIGYGVGCADLCAAGIGAEAEGRIRRGDSLHYERIVVGPPHIRQRLYWVADNVRQRRSWRTCEQRPGGEEATERSEEAHQSERHVSVGWMADPYGGGVQSGGKHGQQQADVVARGVDQSSGSGFVPGPLSGISGDEEEAAQQRRRDGRRPSGSGSNGDVARGVFHPTSDRRGERRPESSRRSTASGRSQGIGFWSGFDILRCTDGKARRIEPGSWPLVDGIPFKLANGRTKRDVSRIETLRGIGNGIVPELAAEFVLAYLETL